MTSGSAKVGARRSSTPARRIAATMIIGSGTVQMTNIAWLATLVPTSKVRATPCFAFDKSTRTFLTALDESLVSTAR